MPHRRLKKAGVKNDIHTQVRLLREADPRISAQFDSKYMSIIERERARLPSTPAGKQFYAVQQADSAAAAAEQELKRYGHLSAATTTRLMDGYQKVLTGQALRAFMMKMYENHIPYNDRAQQALSLFDPHGGGLSANQAHIVLGQLKDLKSSVSNEYAKEVENSARGVDAMGGRGDIIRTTFTGADPSLGPPRDGVRKTQPTTAPHAFAEQSRAQQVLSAGFGAPVTITSGHRSAGHNTKIKGSPSSEHVSGTAYDFKVQGVSPEAAGMKLAAQLIKRGVPFDQILMQPGDTHVGWGSKVRNQLAYEDVRGKVTRALTADQVRHAYQRGEITAAEGETLLSHYFGMK